MHLGKHSLNTVYKIMKVSNAHYLIKFVKYKVTYSVNVFTPERSRFFQTTFSYNTLSCLMSCAENGSGNDDIPCFSDRLFLYLRIIFK